MPWNTTTPILIWAAVAVPYFALLWIFAPRVKFNAILTLLTFAALNLYFFMVVNWVLVNYWLRFLPVLMTVLLALRFFRVNRSRYLVKTDTFAVTPFWPGRRPGALLGMALSLAILLASAYMDGMALRSLSYRNYPGQPVMLFYPLRYGIYVTTNGGSRDGLGMNNAYQDVWGRKTGFPQMAYAVDMMKLENNRGWASKGILPSRMQDYYTFVDPVYSPCVGEVVFVESSLPDHVTAAPADPLGNRVVLKCFEYYVTVANLRQDSVLVKVGEQVSFRVQLGLVGSSGDPGFPHLRVFTTLNSWDETGTPVPQIFDLGLRFLVRNDLFLPAY